MKNNIQNYLNEKLSDITFSDESQAKVMEKIKTLSLNRDKEENTDKVTKEFKNIEKSSVIIEKVEVKDVNKSMWIKYISVAAAFFIIVGSTFAFSRMDRSNNNGGDETTVTTVTSETSETTSVFTSVKNKAIFTNEVKDTTIVTSVVENTSQVETTSVVETQNSEITKIEETQTSNQQKIYEDGGKYSWFKQPIYEFDDVEPVVDYKEYIRRKIVYCDAFKVKKDGKYGLVDVNGELKIDHVYEYIYGGINKGIPCYWANKNNNDNQDEIMCIDFLNYNIFKKEYSCWPREYPYWDLDRNKTVIQEIGEGAYYNLINIDDSDVRLVELAKYIAASTYYENDRFPWERCVGIGQFALCKDNKLITNEVYTSATDLVDNCVAFEKDGKWGYLNEKGEQILPFEFDVAYGNLIRYGTDEKEEEAKYPFICTEGVIAAFKDGQCGYYDNQGNVIVEMGIFEDITPVKDGKAFVKKDGKWGIIKINN